MDDYSFFNKTIAFQGKLQYHYIREKGNQIKKNLLENPTTDMVIENNRANIFAKKGATHSHISNQDRLVTQQVHILDFQPFFCDIKDLVEGGISLNHIYKRQMITPFNLYFNQNDIIELNAKKMRSLKKQHHKHLVRNRDLEMRQSILEQEK